MKTNIKENTKMQTQVVLVLSLEQAKEVERTVARTTSDQELLGHLRKKIARASSGRTTTVTISGPDEQSTYATLNQRKRPHGARR